MNDSRKTMVVLLGVLLGVLVVAGLIVWLLPSQPAAPTIPAQSPTAATGTTGQGLDTSALQRSDYTGLDTHLLQQGALPVQPPTNIGKANPFL